MLLGLLLPHNRMGGGKPPPYFKDCMNIFLAIPSYDGTVTSQCCESILKNTHILRDSGHKVIPYFHSGNVYIAGARNICVFNFLRSDCDEMIFIDSDIGFEDHAMLKLVKYDKDITAGVYPYKQDNFNFPAGLEFDTITHNCKEEETGLVTAEWVPTGFMRIKRQVFGKMIEYYKMGIDHEGVYSFFNTGRIFEGDNTWYGEDVSFCKRWKAMGGKIFIEPRIDFIHTGIKHFKGNYHEFLLGRRVDHHINGLDKQDGLSGWMTDKELDLLREFASKSKDVVEIGSWKGRSTKVLLESCKGTVYAVDHWQGSSNDVTHLMALGKDVYNEFIMNVGSYPNLKILKGFSADMAEGFNGNKVDMIFIDAGHSYEECKSDIEAWLPKCKKIIAGHDFSDSFPGVKKAVTEKFGEVNIIDSIWWKEL